jgi:hypothetical protein
MICFRPLDAPFQAECDHQANGYRGQVNEEFTPAVDGCVGRMNVEHDDLRIS